MPLSISSRWETAVDAVLVSCNPPLAAQRCCASPEPWAAPPFTAANAIVVLNAGLGFRQSRLLILPPAHGEHGAVRSAIHLSSGAASPSTSPATPLNAPSRSNARCGCAIASTTKHLATSSARMFLASTGSVVLGDLIHSRLRGGECPPAGPTGTARSSPSRLTERDIRRPLCSTGRPTKHRLRFFPLLPATWARAGDPYGRDNLCTNSTVFRQIW